MRASTIGAVALVAILLQGCAGYGTRATPAPVSDAGKPPPRATAPVRPEKPAVQVYAFRGSGAVDENSSGPVYTPPPPPPANGDGSSPAHPTTSWQPYSGGGPVGGADKDPPPPNGESRPRPPPPPDTASPSSERPPPSDRPPPADRSPLGDRPPPPKSGGQQDLAMRTPPAPMQASKPVEMLVKQAESQQASGDLTGAAASLERAIGIEARNAHLWNRLARVRLADGQAAQAGDLAAKSNALAGDAPALKQDNWRIIAAARRQAGDAAGAREADDRAGR